MDDFEFDLDAYLTRVGLDSPPPATEDGLRTLHNAQFASIPFENLDIHLGRSIHLHPSHLTDKLIRKPRGGYCFELNGLLLLAMQALSFRARPLLGRVHLTSPPTARTHQISAVELGNRTWIVDVGFGASGPRVPLLLEDEKTFEESDWGFRLQRREPWGWMLQSLGRSGWKDSYSFDFTPATPSDIELGNYYTSTSPDSKFTRFRIVSRPRTVGRASIWNSVLTTVDKGIETERTITDETELLVILAQEFGIELDAPGSALKEIETEPRIGNGT